MFGSLIMHTWLIELRREKKPMATNDLRGFSQRVRLQGKAIEDNATRLLRRTASAIDSAVVLATPVATGRARANWHAEINSASLAVTTDVSPSGSEAITAAKPIIDKAQAGDTVHITNNLPYIGRLNDGWSAQAPAGFVEEAVQVGIDTVRNADLLEGGEG